MLLIYIFVYTTYKYKSPYLCLTNCIWMHYLRVGLMSMSTFLTKWDLLYVLINCTVIVKLCRQVESWKESVVIVMMKRGQMHNREIIRTRPLCTDPWPLPTSTQLCQTAWSIIFSNSRGLESYYRAPSVTQTSVPKQVILPECLLCGFQQINKNVAGDLTTLGWIWILKKIYVARIS